MTLLADRPTVAPGTRETRIARGWDTEATLRAARLVVGDFEFRGWRLVEYRWTAPTPSGAERALEISLEFEAEREDARVVEMRTFAPPRFEDPTTGPALRAVGAIVLLVLLSIAYLLVTGTGPAR